VVARREFIHCAGALALPLLLRQRAPATVTVSLLQAPGAQLAADGVMFGMEEAARTYALLDRTIELAETDALSPGSLAVALIDEPALEATPADALVLDARARFDDAACSGGRIFRIGSGTPDTLVWHPSLERYGAAQLNERFRRRTGRDMDAADWAGWFAIKVVAEAALRANSTDAGALVVWLLGPRARFDGHKGAPLYFDADRRLIQPRYRLTDSSLTDVAAEVSCAR